MKIVVVGLELINLYFAISNQLALSSASMVKVFVVIVLMLCNPGLRIVQLIDKDDFKKLHLLAGSWQTKRSNSTIYEEWTLKSPGELTGKSYQVTATDTTQLETMRLYKEGAMIYYVPKAAGQNNEEEVVFTLKSVEKSKFVFENPKHDFPTRIVYDLKSKDAIEAWIEGKINGTDKRIDYPYTRVIR